MTTANGKRQRTHVTKRQREVLAFISMFIRREQHSPSYQDIGQHFGVTLRAVWEMIDRLQRRGLIARKRFQPRTIRPSRPGC